MSMLNNIRSSRFVVALVTGLCLSTVVLQGCAHNSIYQVTEQGSHKITVINRKGVLTWGNGLKEKDGVATVTIDGIFGNETVLTIANNQLTVYSKNYGTLKDGDSITVDRGRVLVNDKEVQEIASRR